MEQIIISISRENGSGGGAIAGRIAKILQLPFYDRGIITEVAKEMDINLDPRELYKYDEAPRKTLSSRRVRKEYTNSVEEILANKQFEYLKNKAEAGESFVVLGRCADCILKEYKCLLKIFVTADVNAKIDYISHQYNITKPEAEKIIKRTDKERKHYYERYSGGVKWGDSNWYDIVIKSSTIGIDQTADLLAEYIRQVIKTE